MKSRKIIAIFTVLLMLINIVPLTAFASEGTGGSTKKDVIVSVPYDAQEQEKQIDGVTQYLADFNVTIQVINMDADQVTIDGSSPTVAVNLTPYAGDISYQPTLSIVSSDQNHTITATFIDVPAGEYTLNVDIRNSYGYYGRGNYVIVDSYEKTPVVSSLYPRYIQTNRNEVKVYVSGLNLNKFSTTAKAQLVDTSGNTVAESIAMNANGFGNSMNITMTVNEGYLSEGEYKLIIEDGNWDNTLRNKSNNLISTNDLFIGEWMNPNMVGFGATNFKLEIEANNINQNMDNITFKLKNDKNDVWNASKVTVQEFATGGNTGVLTAYFENLSTPISAGNPHLEVIIEQNGSPILGSQGKSVYLTFNPIIYETNQILPIGLEEYNMILNGTNLNNKSDYVITIFEHSDSVTQVLGEIKNLSTTPNTMTFTFRPTQTLKENTMYRIEVKRQDGNSVGDSWFHLGGTVPPPAPTNTQIEVGKTFGLTDSIVEVPVTINNVDKLTGGKIVINFDPGTVYLEEVIPGDLLEEGDLFIHNIYQDHYYNQPGRLEIIFASPNAKTGSGEIAKLKFRITGNQTTSISVSAPELELEGDTDIEGQGRIIPATIKDGGITVASLGDVDRNGRITTYDATLILRHVVGLTNLTTEQKIIADVNKDGVIDSGDAILILQYIVGNISF